MRSCSRCILSHLCWSFSHLTVTITAQFCFSVPSPNLLRCSWMSVVWKYNRGVTSCDVDERKITQILSRQERDEDGEIKRQRRRRGRRLKFCIFLECLLVPTICMLVCVCVCVGMSLSLKNVVENWETGSLHQNGEVGTVQTHTHTKFSHVLAITTVISH